MDVLLFANGELKQGKMLKRLLTWLESPRVICADGGALHARRLGLKPHTIIGDLDSLSAAQVAQFRADGADIIQHAPEKDETDLELALHHCGNIGAASIYILGALGGRFDQTLANILLLMLPFLRGIRVEIVDGDQTIRLLWPGEHKIWGRAGDTISLIPLSRSEGIRTRDLQYPLNKESLQFGPARGISNIIVGEAPAVQFTGGRLLLVHTSGRA